MKILEPLFRNRTLERDFSLDWWLEQYHLAQWTTSGNTYLQPFQTTIPGQKAAPIAQTFAGYLEGGYAGNSVIFGLASVRMRVFSEARFQFQRLRNGRPGDLWGDATLALLETPWPGGTTGDLLSAMILHADFAGNAFVVRSGDRLVLLRPDWVQIMLTDAGYDNGVQAGAVGFRTIGYKYFHGGITAQKQPVVFGVDEVAHFMPQPDPRCAYNVGMSWLTPVIREIQADGAATTHKLKFFENAATPNLAVSLPEKLTRDQFREFVDMMDEQHKGAANAYKTLYTANGADVTVVGASMQQMDFKATQGAGETRLAQAAGVPAVVAGISEGLAGSSLNSGNFGQARRQFAEMTMANLWRNVAGSLEVIVPAPGGSRLWFDTRDIAFLREDQADAAKIQATEAQTIKALTEAGFEPDSILNAVMNEDWTLLVGQHTGLYSVQLQTPGSTKMPTVPAPEEIAAGISQKPGMDLAPKALPPAGRSDEPPIFNINIDARSIIERGAFEITQGDNHIDARTENGQGAFQFDAAVDARSEVHVPEQPTPNVEVTVEAAQPKAMHRTMVRDDDNRIIETIDRYEDE